MCSANAPKIDRTNMSVEILFDGANGRIADRVVEDLDWSRIFKLQPDACVLGECTCDGTCDCEHEFCSGDCESRRDHMSDCRDEFLDDLCFHSGAFVALIERHGIPHASAMHALSVARDAEKEGKDDETIVGALESEGWQIFNFELHEGDVFLVPWHWESEDDGSWRPPADEIVDRVIKQGDVEVSAEWEQCSVDGHAGDAEAVAWVREQIAADNVWGWAQVTVEVTIDGHTASDHLGACSYESEADFRANSGYFRDMVRTCVDELLKRRTFDWS